MTEAGRALRTRWPEMLFAATLWLSAYLIAYGPGIMTALQLFTPDTQATPTADPSAAGTEEYILSWVATAIGLVFASGAIALSVLDTPRTRWLPCPAHRCVTAAGLYGMVAFVSLVVALLIADATTSGTSINTGLPGWVDIANALNAGIGEEIIVLAAPVFIAAAAFGDHQRALIALLAIAVPARLAYHLYYGPAVLGLLIWATVAIVIFWKWRSWQVLAAFIIVHTVIDLLDTWTERQIFALICTAAALVAAVIGRRAETDGDMP
ncbi:hypothetical protein OG921_24215 [Aldersonia sp. NBC_00410]|uniref:hypothetical protein n=1 Tax=Aldersonia sp. NBC_00410 TaxID=2975954 RepID=UPI00224EF621|nr:hypothetical protein [Aldersonia sp. NBC_00410]MCX5046281.1 hypothetical protein [Aldersonia sp. NBC_00410]